jgi:uncharacterized protein YjdB
MSQTIVQLINAMARNRATITVHTKDGKEYRGVAVRANKNITVLKAPQRPQDFKAGAAVLLAARCIVTDQIASIDYQDFFDAQIKSE